MSLARAEEVAREELTRVIGSLASMKIEVDKGLSSADAKVKEYSQQISAMLTFYQTMLHEKGEQDLKEMIKTNVKALEELLYNENAERDFNSKFEILQNMLKAQMEKLAESLLDRIGKLTDKIQELGQKIDSLKEISAKLEKQIDLLTNVLKPDENGKLSTVNLKEFIEFKSKEIEAMKMSIVNKDGVYTDKDLDEPQKQFLLANKIKSGIENNTLQGAGDPLVRKLESINDVQQSKLMLKNFDVKAEIKKCEMNTEKIESMRSKAIEDRKTIELTGTDSYIAKIKNSFV